MSSTFAELVDEVQELDTDTKEELASLIKAWLIEERREGIVRNAMDTDRELQEGTSKSGGIDDLMADLDAED